VEVHADGSVASPWGAGKWKTVPSAAVERKYEIDWVVNAAVDTFVLAAEGKRFEGKNNRGQRVVATRVE